MNQNTFLQQAKAEKRSYLLYFFIYCPLGAVSPLIGQYLSSIGFSGTQVGSTPLVKCVCERVAARLTAMRGGETLLGVLESVVLLAVFALSIAFLVSGSYNPFLYFRF